MEQLDYNTYCFAGLWDSGSMIRVGAHDAAANVSVSYACRRFSGVD